MLLMLRYGLHLQIYSKEEVEATDLKGLNLPSISIVGILIKLNHLECLQWVLRETKCDFRQIFGWI
jgi:hypothetical protein